MKKVWLLAVGILLILATVSLYGCSQEGAVSGASNLKVDLGGQQEGIWVSGKGEAFAAPDIAILVLGIQAQAPTVADAQSQAATAMANVMSALTGNGMDKKDIQTQYFSIQQLTRYDKDTQQNVVIGYQVTNTVTAKIRAIDKTGAIIDSVAKAGGDLTRINSISFSIDNPAPYSNDARQKAMADAKAKAEQMAGLAGVKLGKPTYISESAYIPVPPSPVMRSDAAAAPVPETPISPGQMTISVNVQVAYAILN